MSDGQPQGPEVRVTSLATARRAKRRFGAVLTIEDPGLKHGLRFHKRPAPEQLVLMFEDIDDDRRPQFASASPEQVAAGLEFGQSMLDSGKSLLIHCKAGVSRSTALCIGVLAAHLGDGSEDEAVRQLFTIRPESVPNLHVLWLADEILGRDGRLFDALVRFESSNAEYFDYHRNRRAETLKISPGLYARGLPEGVTGIHRFVREQAMVTSPVGLTAR